MDIVKLKISEQKFFNNADLLLPSIKDASGANLQAGIESWLSQSYELTPKTRVNSRTGYDANELNTVLRQKINTISGIHGETFVSHGSILKVGKKGFDFSLFDEEYNIIKIRNAYIGTPGIYNGDTELLSINSQVLSANDKPFGKREWKKKLAELGGTPGENISCKKSRYTVVGEIQFGNWALAEHDLLRLLNSAVEGEIDYYIYIAATGNLEKKLSDGIVTYSKAVNLFYEDRQLLRLPVWVIGIDLE